jgi:hypothetical protein
MIARIPKAMTSEVLVESEESGIVGLGAADDWVKYLRSEVIPRNPQSCEIINVLS